MKYKDRNGNPLKQGDIIATAITCNQERFMLSYQVAIIKKKGRHLIYDSPTGWGNLSERNPKEIQKLMPDTDLRTLWAEWIREHKDRFSFNDDVRESNADWKKIVEHIKADREDIAFDVFKTSIENTDSYDEVLDSLKTLKRKVNETLGLKNDVLKTLRSIKYQAKKIRDAKKQLRPLEIRE